MGETNKMLAETVNVMYGDMRNMRSGHDVVTLSLRSEIKQLQERLVYKEEVITTLRKEMKNVIDVSGKCACGAPLPEKCTTCISSEKLQKTDTL